MRFGGSSLLVLTYLGFVSLGLPDAAYGVAWPSLRTDFSLGQSAFGLGLLAVGTGYFCSSLTAGSLLRRFGVGRLLGVSTLITASGLVGFALAPHWLVFLAFGLAVGVGGGAIDSGLNAYAANHYSARHMNWLHAAFGFGAALGPLAMTAALTGGGWRFGYLAIAAFMLLLAGLFLASRRRWEDGSAATAAGAHASGRALDAVKVPAVWLQVATFFVYTGVEIAAGQWAFAVLSQSRGFSVEAAGFWTGAFWFALFAGRVLLGFGAEAIGTDRLIRGGAIVSALGLALFALDSTGLGVVGLIATGFACAPIFPMLMHKTPQMLGPEITAQSIGFQVSAAMLGGVAFPSLAGFAAGLFGLASVPLVLLASALAFLVLVEVGVRIHPARRGA